MLSTGASKGDRAVKKVARLAYRRDFTGPRHASTPRAVYGARDDGRGGDRGDQPRRCRLGSRIEKRDSVVPKFVSDQKG